jgi:glycosyltransferase involved in cell wall biosynthesis
MPVHNAEATLASALESILRQTFARWELVAVNDGSTDATAQLLDHFAGKDFRIRPFAQPRQGIVSALNLGLSFSRGQLIARMDADDQMHPRRLERQWGFLQENPWAGLVACQVEFASNQSSNGYRHHVEWTNTLLAPGQIRLSRFIESPFAHPSVMFRKELANRHGSYREGPFPEDYELWLRWLDCGVEMAKIPEILLTWNDHPGRLSRCDQRYSSEAFYRLKARYLAAPRGVHGRPCSELEHARAATRRLWLWGAGRKSRQRFRFFEEISPIPLAGYIDIDPVKIQRTIHDLPVLGSDRLPHPETSFILSYVGSRGAREQIRQRLNQAGYQEGASFLLAA